MRLVEVDGSGAGALPQPLRCSHPLQWRLPRGHPCWQVLVRVLGPEVCHVGDGAVDRWVWSAALFHLILLFVPFSLVWTRWVTSNQNFGPVLNCCLISPPPPIFLFRLLGLFGVVDGKGTLWPLQGRGAPNCGPFHKDRSWICFVFSEGSGVSFPTVTKRVAHHLSCALNTSFVFMLPYLTWKKIASITVFWIVLLGVYLKGLS